MSKRKKSQTNLPDPDDIIAGRQKSGARELALLIREINPTGLDLSPSETARRYTQKSRLQSLLITRFHDEIEVRPDPKDPAIVGIFHRPSGIDACHAVIAELNEEARAWVQRSVDIESSVSESQLDLSSPPQTQRSQKKQHKNSPSMGRSGAAHVSGGQTMPAAEFLRMGNEALREYDFDSARTHFENSLSQSKGDVESARALLSLLVDSLGADEDALAVYKQLSSKARQDPAVRLLLALAAARSGSREWALRCVYEGAWEEGGRNIRVDLYDPRAAEVFAYLARAALATGRLDEAASDITQVRERDASCPELSALMDMLMKARAAARAPAEVELEQVFAQGDISGARKRAAEILASWPDSTIARRIARAIDEQKRREQAKNRLMSAKEALARGEILVGIELLRQALGSGLQGEDALWAENRLADLDLQQKQREEQSRMDEVRAKMATGQHAEAFSAYVLLDLEKRRAVRDSLGALSLSWLEDFMFTGAGAKAKVAIPALLALSRAAAIAEKEAKAAIELLDAHWGVLSGFKPAEEIRRNAQHVLVEQQRKENQQKLQEASLALDAGDLDVCDELVASALANACSEPEKAKLEALRATLRFLIEERDLRICIEQDRRHGNGLRALSAVEILLENAEGSELLRLQAMWQEIRDEIRRHFCVQVQHLPPSSAKGRKGVVPGIFHDMGLTPDYQWNTLLSIPLPGEPDADALVFAQSKCEWVFLRIVHPASSRETLRVILRTPEPLILIKVKAVERRLILVGAHGAVLELSLDDWAVLRWCANVLGNQALGRSLPVEGSHGTPAKYLEEADLSSDGRFLWLNTTSSLRGTGTRRLIHVVDLEKMRAVRELQVNPPENVFVRELRGLSEPSMAILHRDGRGFTLYSPHGSAASDSLPVPFLGPNAIMASSSDERIFAVLLDPDEAETPYSAAWGWVEIRGSKISEIRYFKGITAVRNASTVANREAGMIFVLFEMSHRPCELFGLREEPSGFKIVYNVQVPSRAALFGSSDGQRGILLALYDDHLEVAMLVATPPKVTPDETPDLISIPTVREPPFNTIADCNELINAYETEVETFGAELKREPKPVLARRIAIMRDQASADELRLTEALLLAADEDALARQVREAAQRRFPNHPGVRLSAAGESAKRANWKEVLEQLSAIQVSGLVNSPEIMHYYHLRGMAKMMLGRADAALADLKWAAQEHGTCLLHPFLAICTPLSEKSIDWTLNEIAIRHLLSILYRADGALGKSDAALALEILNTPRVWEAREAQSLGRFADAYLQVLEAGDECDHFRMSLASLWFCEMVEEGWNTPHYREMPMARSMWDRKSLLSLAAKVRARVDAMLREEALKH